MGSTIGVQNQAAQRIGGNWDLWPSDLRVREYPAVREAVTA